MQGNNNNNKKSYLILLYVFEIMRLSKVSTSRKVRVQGPLYNSLTFSYLSRVQRKLFKCVIAPEQADRQRQEGGGKEKFYIYKLILLTT